ncbi:N-acetyltransferase GCN5 [Clostridium putrefaciens]|uniref:N-acetyltransferase GCN5 n=1 Tax=Clostridium putrefaciens TaxID=99675 RepID=A0A381JBA3_9CLOT|nr:GNAT family N-acetyltransferase [Clostridium putrefaciens]SUY47677.1 N-acetyltransferase GCN5 [Clostridium putrefaciens]
MIETIKKIETKRLILREISENDVDGIYKVFSDPAVAKYDWFSPIESKDDAIKFIKRYKEEFESGEEITWGIELKDTKELIGICCLGDFDNGARRSEIGYDLAKDKWNKGYATEAIEAIVKFGLSEMDLNRIEAFITPGNDASVKVLEKLNFTKEGVVRERDLIKGKLEDGIIMSILQKDIV